MLSLPAGVLADREHKLRLVTIAQSLLLVEALALWWLTFTGHITIGWLLLLAAVNGAVSAVEIPARQSMMIELVGRDDLRDAIALNSSGFNLARIFGPGVAAAVIAKAGISWCFGLNALSYFTVLIGLSRIQLPPWHPPLTTGSPLHGMLEGIRYVRATKKVSTLIRFIAVFSVLGVPYITLDARRRARPARPRCQRLRRPAVVPRRWAGSVVRSRSLPWVADCRAANCSSARPTRTRSC